MKSLATFKYIGYTDQKAKELWDNWKQHRCNEDGCFLDTCVMPIHQTINTQFDAYDDTHDWHGIMNDCGLSPAFQESILDPRFTSIRMTQSALRWVLRTILLRYFTLESISDSSKHRKHARVGSVPCVQCSRQDQIKSEQASKDEATEEPIILYREIDISTSNHLFDDPLSYCDSQLPCIASLSEYEMPSALASWKFDARSTTFYRSLPLASLFAAYAAVRSNGHSPPLLCKLTVPIHLFAGLCLNTFQKNYTETWGQLVWINVHGADPNSVDGVNDVVAQTIDDDSDLVIGPTLTSAGGAIEGKEDWKDVTDQNILKFGGENMLEYSFMGHNWSIVLDGKEGVKVEKVEL